MMTYHYPDDERGNCMLIFYFKFLRYSMQLMIRYLHGKSNIFHVNKVRI